MDIKKLAPWNWFKKEQEDAGKSVPVHNPSVNETLGGGDHPLVSFHREFDRLFNTMLHGFGMPPLGLSRTAWPALTHDILKPTLDISSTENAYTASVEVPGVKEDDVKLELSDGTLIIRGEKKQAKESKDKDFYCIERSYGAFRRVLSLPEDVDHDHIRAVFENGVLTITMPRKALPKSKVKRIEVRKAA
jgi:HSP20 family protein